MIFSCPGSGKFKQPEPREARCPLCGEEAEVWTDEAEVVCRKCGGRVKKDAGQSCLDWCKYAKICIGYKMIAGNQWR